MGGRKTINTTLCTASLSSLGCSSLTVPSSPHLTPRISAPNVGWSSTMLMVLGNSFLGAVGGLVVVVIFELWLVVMLLYL